MKNVRLVSFIEGLIITGFAILPVFFHFPYRVNIFLSWEGAYRISQGQVPFRDFGIPMGYMYWALPAFFFKIFGAQLITLVKAQAMLNLLSGFAFRSILKSFSLQGALRLASVLFYVVSFSFLNFWPWYNHTVIVYEMVSIAFACLFLLGNGRTRWLVLSGIFAFFSFFTKQDAGALCIVLVGSLLIFHAYREKKWKAPLAFALSVAVTTLVMVLPLTRYDFGYWFNLGQAPHTARVSPAEILEELLGGSQGLKLAILTVAGSALLLHKKTAGFFREMNELLFLLLTLGILVQAAILQVTSYTPPDNNIYYQSFAVAYVLHALSRLVDLRLGNWWAAILVCAGIFFWRSEQFMNYISRMVARGVNDQPAISATGENMVNRKTYKISAKRDDIPESEWIPAGLPSFKNMLMPAPTADGLKRIMQMEAVKNKNPKVLNMTELTPLAADIPFDLEKGPQQPLWYHLGVGMFNRQAAMFEDRIAGKYYDLVLFEYIPSLNNFYPFRVRDSLRVHYRLVDSFYAPRRGAETMGRVEVYLR